MDLGCLDLGCISESNKQNADELIDSLNKLGDFSNGSSATSSSKVGKMKSSKETSPSALNALNKFTSQIKKPPHRKSSPLNWFPRKKVDSFLKRKIKMLQELDGMNLTLDETLGDSNPHYCRVLREKMAAREAANKAMEARKAAMVEASWCRILKAARIESKEAEVVLLKAEKTAAEAFEAAMAMGVIMYDIPDCLQKTCQIETSSARGSTTHTVKASFETAFEVYKQVAAAVKTAFVRLASCPSFNKDEFKELLKKISENPDTGDCNQEVTEILSECELEARSELETIAQMDGFVSQRLEHKSPVTETRRKKSKRRQSLEKFNMEKLIEMMLKRLKCLQEDELSSLATIVATCGLNAALAEVEHTKLHNPYTDSEYPSDSNLSFSRRMSTAGARTRKTNNEYPIDGPMRKKQVESELPSLDKFLVKHMTKLEREVQEAKNKRNGHESVNSDKETISSEAVPNLESILVKHSSKFEKEIQEAKKNFSENSVTDHKSSDKDTASSTSMPDLGSILVKKLSKLEREIQLTKRNNGRAFEMNGKKTGGMPNGLPRCMRADIPEVPSLDKFLVKHVTRLEREVEEAKNRRKNNAVEGGRKADEVLPEKDTSFNGEKENMELNTEVQGTGGGSLMIEKLYKETGNQKNEDSLEKILVKPVHRLEREKMQALSSGSAYENKQKQGGTNYTDCESLDKVLVKHVSRLEREKMRASEREEVVKVKRTGINMPQVNSEDSLDKVLVQHKSRLEKEKMAAAAVQPEEPIRLSVSRREARQKELQEAWGGLSLGNSIKPHISKLERDKAAWIKAEEEERRQAMNEV
ncbi:hypothetical protein SLA2020_081780 [Shorea laevis]